MSAPEVEGHPMLSDDVVPPVAKPKVSRRRLMQESALTAGALALASQLDKTEALAQADVATPSPQSPPADRELQFDFPGLEIGTAEYPEATTGCTVLHFPIEAFPTGVMLELDIRGGAPGYSGDYGITNAICLAGGSVYGLEAAAGVASELFAQGRYADLVPVAGAIIYDVSVVEPPDGTRDKGIYPDKALGQAAVRAARPGRFPLGPHGAGAGATAGQQFDFPNQRERCGQGGAFRQIGPIRIAVFTVVNALGVVVDRQGQVVRGGLDRQTGVRLSPMENAEQTLAAVSGSARSSATTRLGGPTRHTTLTALVINAALPRELLRQLGRQVHSSMARAIQPFHTPDDGDILFTATTGEIAGEGIDSVALGIVASELAWDAVLSSFDPNT